MPSLWRGATCGWRCKVFHCPQLTRIFRNSRPLCTIHLQIPSLMPLEMPKVQLSYGRVPDSTPGTLPTPPCATSTVHAGRHNSTLKTAAHHHGGCTLRRRYSRFTARLTVAGDTPKDLATLRWPPSR